MQKPLGLLALAMVLFALCCAASPHAFARAQKTADFLRFQATRNGQPLGWHEVSIRRDGARTVVKIDIALDVHVLFIPVYRYRHENTEIWEGQRLVSLESHTDDNGRKHRVSAKRDGSRIFITADGTTKTAPGDIMTTSYWNKASMTRDRLLNTQTGEIVRVATQKLGTEDWTTSDGKNLRAQRFRISGDLKADILYESGSRKWVGLEFTAKGATIRYRIDPKNDPESHGTI